jgi:hypothetical protein
LAGASRLVARSYQVTAPAQDKNAYLADLHRIVAAEKIDLVLPVSEETMHVAFLRESLPASTRLFTMPPESLLRLHNKHGFAQQAASWGMSVPETHALGDPAAEALAQAGPVVVKPVHSCSGRGVRLLPAGSALPGIAPSNAYRCRDGLVLIAGNGDSIFTRLMNVISREDLGGRADLANNQGRVRAVVEIDHAIEEWTGPRTVEEVLADLRSAGVPGGRIYTAKDISEDAHYRAREMILRQQTRQGFEVEVPGIVPKLMTTPGAVRTPAPGLGEHTRVVLAALGLSETDQDDLRVKGVIA